LSSLFDLLIRVGRDLQDCDARWALVGGLAVGARTEPRFTRDLDVVVAVADDEAAEHLVLSMRGKGYQISAVLEQAQTGRLATVRLLPSGDGRLADLLFASTGIEEEIVKEAELLEISPQVKAPVAGVGHLIAMKVLSRDDLRRPQDRLDLAALMEVATEDELDLARHAAQTIVERGCARGRPLVEELADLVKELRIPCKKPDDLSPKQ
jgi:hypothetical protein